MKKLLFIILIFVALVSCNKEDLNNNISNYSNSDKYLNFSTDSLIVLPNGMKVNVVNGRYIYQGDIILSDEQIKIAQQPITKSVILNQYGRLWSNNTIHYKISNDIVNDANYNEYYIYAAINHWEAQTSIDFVEDANPTGDYVEFVKSSTPGVCWSYYGKVGGRQTIELCSNFSTGAVIHEIGHTVGLIHEHARPDRNFYIDVFLNNVFTAYLSQFDVWPYTDCFYFGDFDFNSIMLYDSYAFTGNSLPTMLKKDGSSFFPQTLGLSDGDIDGVQRVYGPPYVKLVKTVISENSQMTDYWDTYEINTTDSLYFYSDKNCTNRITSTHPRVVKIERADYSLSGPTYTYYYLYLPAGISSYWVAESYYAEWNSMGNKEKWEGSLYTLDGLGH
jgi:hypothetical protein